MKTLKRTLMIVCMALALVCMTAPSGHTQGVTTPKTICAKCGVVTPVGQCPPAAKLTNRTCVEINANGAQKPAMTLPMILPRSTATEGAEAVSHSEATVYAKDETSLAGWLKARETRKAQKTSPGQ